MTHFQVKHSGTGQPKHFYAQTKEGKLLSTISPLLQANSKYSDRFLNVCHMDGSTELANGMAHASSLIEKKYFSQYDSNTVLTGSL